MAAKTYTKLLLTYSKLEYFRAFTQARVLPIYRRAVFHVSRELSRDTDLPEDFLYDLRALYTDRLRTGIGSYPWTAKADAPREKKEEQEITKEGRMDSFDEKRFLFLFAWKAKEKKSRALDRTTISYLTNITFEPYYTVSPVLHLDRISVERRKTACNSGRPLIASSYILSSLVN